MSKHESLKQFLKSADVGLHSYSERKTRPRSRHVPLIRANICIGEGRYWRDFVLDTGAQRSVAPRSYVAGLMNLGEPEDSGLKDVHGNPLIGAPAIVSLELLFYYPRKPLLITETIWFCEGIRHGLLGQSTFFEQLGVVFLNFPKNADGRRFGIFSLDQ